MNIQAPKNHASLAEPKTLRADAGSRTVVNPSADAAPANSTSQERPSNILARLVGGLLDGHDAARLKAICETQAIIEFKPDGTILEANDNFLAAMGYQAHEIIGKHHRIFVDPAEAKSDSYRQFWTDLSQGKMTSGDFKRQKKDGSPIWIHGAYAPVKDSHGQVTRVIKSCTDITAAKMEAIHNNHVLKAIGRSMAVIQFTPDGQILEANDNFLSVMGYSLDEIVGQHHRIFVDPPYAVSDDYASFWRRLAKGEDFVGQFRRLAKSGEAVYIQASYSAVFDEAGTVERVIKVASDATADTQRALYDKGQLDGISRSQAVIHFEPDGTIIKANENFCAAVGYTLEEIVGKHHSIFAKPDYAASDAYRRHWEELRAGEFKQDEYERVRKDGSALWINATYTPICDGEGTVFKVVKFANDIKA